MPDDPTRPSPELRAAVEEVIGVKIRPGIEGDGGTIDLVDIDPSKGIVWVKMGGTCSGCALSQMTLFGFVQRTLVLEIPGLQEVRPV